MTIVEASPREARGGVLAGRTVVVTGVITQESIAFHAARVAQEQGAHVLLTGFGRLGLVRRIAQRLPEPAPVLELDVTDQEQLDSLAARLSAHTSRVDGVIHSIGFAPQQVMGGNFLQADWDDVATALQVSTYSLVSLTRAVLPLMSSGGSVVGLDFDAQVAWDDYDWMGVAKAGLESACRYLARDLGPHGIRANLVAAGPIRSMASRNIPGHGEFESAWAQQAPLGWKGDNHDAVARTCVALLSDLLPSTTGEVVHADGGFHAMGMRVAERDVQEAV